MQVAKNKVVSIDYTLTNDKGDVIDSSKGQPPMVYLHGTGNLIPGLERQLEGKAAGQSITAKVGPEEGYGKRDPAMVQAVPRDRFAGIADIKVGMQFQAQAQGHSRIVTITKVEDDNITVDANHPLAGENLNFDVKIVEVRDATKEELEHGHVHGAGGHHH